VQPRERPAVLILGSGPNRIGQGIEFDYSCVHAVMALQDAGYEAVMVNCNPETVSTDYDTADRLYFEPLTFEDVLEVVEAERAAGRSPGSSARSAGRRRWAWRSGSRTPASRCWAPRRRRSTTPSTAGAFSRVLPTPGLLAPKHGTATTFAEAREIAADHRLPGAGPALLRARRARDGDRLRRRHARGLHRQGDRRQPAHPVLVDRFLEDAVEIDVDALYDGTDLYLGGVMEHIEEAGIHSGDSACALPPITLGSATCSRSGPPPRSWPPASACAG
jgi:carbamoyl-phosphate synthase large subunit